MQEVKELRRLPSPAPRPQSLAFDGDRLWMGSVETQRLYAIDPVHWTVREEAKAPGKPWGMAVVGDELRVIYGVGADDDRVVGRFVPGHGFKDSESFACPEGTGSQLGYDGDFLYVSQWYNQRILQVSDRGKVMRSIATPRGICGLVVVNARFYILNTDNEESNDYFLTRIDARTETPVVEDLARVPFAARGLTFDGERFWTNHRESGEIVAFANP
jgi:hypothetical protein